MAKKQYKVASQEGADFAARSHPGEVFEIGQEVEIDFGMKEAEEAVLAAGWLEQIDDKKGKK